MKIISAVVLDDHHIEKIKETLPAGGELVLLEGKLPARGEATNRWVIDQLTKHPDAQVLISGLLPSERPQNSQLKWIHLSSAGVDRDQSSPYWNSDVVITSSVGVHGAPISEWTLLGMLSHAHKTLGVVKSQLAGEWGDRQALRANLLLGKTVGLYGFGSIGREVARLTGAFGMRNLVYRPESMGTTSRDRYVPDFLSQRSGNAPGYDDVTVVDFDTMLSESDYLVISAPYTPQTAGSIRLPELQKMKTSACVVVNSRGGIVAENDLIHALRYGLIDFAVLDVFEQEPLSEDSELWGLDNVLLYPHLSGGFHGYYDIVIDIFLQNLGEYCETGHPAFNIVDAKSGY